MRRADSGQAARHNLAALGDELAEQPVVLVVDVFDFLDAELTDLLAPEKLASAFARTARTARTSTAAESRAVSTGTRAVVPWPLWRGRLLWCFCFVSHLLSPHL
jgi:hypothetical protein